MKYYGLFLFALMGVYTVHLHDARLTELSDDLQYDYSFVDSSNQANQLREPAQKDNDNVEEANPKDIIAPVVMKSPNSDDVYVGAFAAEEKDPSQIDPNEINKIRQQLQVVKIEGAYHISTKGMDGSAAQFEEAKSRADRIIERDAWVDYNAKINGAQIADRAKIKLQVKTQNLKYIEQRKAAALKQLKSIYKTKRSLAEVSLMHFELPYQTLVNFFENTMTTADKKIYMEKVSELSADAKATLGSKKTYRQGFDHVSSLNYGETFKQKTLHFGPETFTFFVAVGAVTFNTMWIKSHGDPLAMERHIKSLKDPIAHLSFYAFMQANGFYTTFHTSTAAYAAMNESTRARYMTRLSYVGMGVGSIASSIVADVGQSVMSCVDSWFKGKKDSASLTSCDEAWKQWTVRRITTQYFPKIITMWAAQNAASLVEKGIVKGFKKVPIKLSGKMIKEGLIRLVSKIKAVDVVIVATPAGWEKMTVKFLGSVARIGVFVTMDQIISKYVNRPLNNQVLPFMSFYDFKDLNALWLEADRGNWDPAKLSTINQQNTEKFEKEIRNYTENMQEWRNHLNENVEVDLMGWMEMTKKLLNQSDYAYKFYDAFASTLAKDLDTKERVKIKDETDPRFLGSGALNLLSGHPYRTFPFYGVSGGKFKPIGKRPVSDFYLIRPQELQPYQKDHLLNVTAKYVAKKYKFSDPKENAKYQEILKNLSSGVDLTMANGLFLLNDIYLQYELGIKELAYASYSRVLGNMGNPGLALSGMLVQQKAKYDMRKYSKELIDVVSPLYAEIGRPYPIIYPFAGFSQAFAANTDYQSAGEQADYSSWSLRNRYNFNKVSDLMMYNMFCGKDKAWIKKYELGVAWLSPEFVPPNVLKNTKDRDDYCNSVTTSTNMYNSLIGGKNLLTYFKENFDDDMVKDYMLDSDHKKSFDNWWTSKTRIPLKNEFKNYDQSYKHIVAKTYDNLKGNYGLYEKVADVSNHFKYYYPTSINETMKTETNVYLQLINRALMNDPSLDQSARAEVKKAKEEKRSYFSAIGNLIKDTVSGSFDTAAHFAYTGHDGTDEELDYIRRANTFINDKGFKSMYSDQGTKKTANEVLVLDSLLTKNYKFIGIKSEQYGSYVEHAKDLDTAINEVLVRAGLMVKIEKTEEEKDVGAFADTSEVTRYTYLPASDTRMFELKDKAAYFAKKIINMIGTKEGTPAEIEIQKHKFIKAIDNFEWAITDQRFHKILKSTKDYTLDTINEMAVYADGKVTKAQLETRKVSLNKWIDETYGNFYIQAKGKTEFNNRQRIIMAAVEGLRQVDSEIKRFVRMGTLLSNSLEQDNKDDEINLTK